MIKMGKKISLVCELSAQGFTQSQIAAQIGISTNSVKTYRRRAYRYFGVSDKAGLMARLRHA